MGNPSPPDDHAADTADEHRVAKRDSLLMAAELQTEGGHHRHAIRIRNISATGLMAECTDPLKEGASVSVALRNIGDVPGVISWVRGGRFGMAFDREINPQHVRRPVGNGQSSGPLPVYLRSVPQLPRRGF